MEIVIEKHFVCGKSIVGWEIVYHPQGRVDAFGLCQDRQVQTG